MDTFKLLHEPGDLQTAINDITDRIGQTRAVGFGPSDDSETRELLRRHLGVLLDLQAKQFSLVESLQPADAMKRIAELENICRLIVRMRNTPIVDDDFPEVMNDVDTALTLAGFQI